MCRRCAGTGYGEEVADLGEAGWHGADLPVRQCKSCSGSGAVAVKTKISPAGPALIVAALAAVWACPAGARWIVMVSVVSIAILGSAWWHDRVREAKTEADAPSPSTEGVLALNAAVERHRQVEAHIESRQETGQTKVN